MHSHAVDLVSNGDSTIATLRDHPNRGVNDNRRHEKIIYVSLICAVCRYRIYQRRGAAARAGGGDP